MIKFQNHFGLDMGADSIKIVQLASVAGGKFKLAAMGMVQTPKFETQVQWDAATETAVRKLVKDVKVNCRQTVISLAEAQVYTRVLELPFMEEPDLAQAISWQAEQYVPVPLSEVLLRHHVLSVPREGVPGDKMSVLLLAVPNDVLNHYMSIAAVTGLEVIGVETEILAIIRSLTSSVDNFPVSLLVHMGGETTTFAIFRQDNIYMIQSVGTGGMAITRSIATELNLSATQAEQYKRSYGLDHAKLEGKVAGAIRPVVDYILGETKRVLGAYESRGHGERDPVKRLILSGGGSILPGLVSYLVGALNVEVQLGNPFYNIALSDSQKLEVGEIGPVLSVAVGLAAKPT